ncbi:hypothetical protein J7E62_09205 [Variovorax paradoxus]|nr:hypothetical protein [Variovorax paradoxus]
MAETTNWGLGDANPYLGKSNPQLQSIIDLTTKDMVDNYGRTVLPASNAAMLRSGSFGNSGLQEMERANAEGLQRNIGDAASKLRFNDYGQQQQMFQWDQGAQEGKRRYDLDFDRGVFNDGYAQNMGNLQAGMGLLSVLGGFNASDINNSTTQQNAPLDYLRQFSGIAQGLGGMGGSGTSTQGTSSNPLATALGGAQLGNSWWNSNNSSGSSPSSGGWNWGGTDSTGYNSSTGSWFA